MSAKINHLAITSDNYTRAAEFYESIFGMQTSPKWRSPRSIAMSDGYIGLNFNPRSAAKSARLDHFGIEVTDVEAVLERMHKKYPKVLWLQRPASRPYAGVTTHDPDGNPFDLSKREMTNRAGVYTEEKPLQKRHVGHFALRTVNHEETAAFYQEIFELEASRAGSKDPNIYLTDGHITMVVMPWQITDYAGTSIQAPCVDHIGFNVESLEHFKEDVARIGSENPQLAPYPLGLGPESKIRLELAQRSCPLCDHFLADPEAVLLSVTQK